MSLEAAGGVLGALVCQFVVLHLLGVTSHVVEEEGIRSFSGSWRGQPDTGSHFTYSPDHRAPPSTAHGLNVNPPKQEHPT